MIRERIRQFISKFKPQDGTSAIEFAIAAPVFFLLVFVGIDLSTILWEQYSLNYAVSNAARYAYVNPSKSSAAVQSYALSVIPALPDTPTITVAITPMVQATINASLTHTFIYYPFGTTTITAKVVQPLQTP
jgi:Flp pilus assembly protein TadG